MKNNPKTIEPTNQDFRSKLYQIQNMLVQGVQEIPADKSDKPINKKMENYYNLRRKWIDHSMEEIITLIDLYIIGVPEDVDMGQINSLGYESGSWDAYTRNRLKAKQRTNLRIKGDSK